MATHSSILACRIPETEDPGGLPSMGSRRVRHNWRDFAVEQQNPMERGAWKTTVQRVAQSWTQLK